MKSVCVCEAPFPEFIPEMYLQQVPQQVASGHKGLNTSKMSHEK